MASLGEVRKGSEIGYKNLTSLFIWHACVDCGRERWVRFVKGEIRRLRCKPCAKMGSKNPAWRGGRTIDKRNNYVYVLVNHNDFFYPMADRVKRRVLEHRLIMAKHLNRCLLAWEIVHHRNGIKNDNRLENLQLMPTRNYHIADQLMKRENLRLKKRVDNLEKRVTLLEAENILLRQDSALINMGDD